jgi:hypothetical protein
MAAWDIVRQRGGITRTQSVAPNYDKGLREKSYENRAD